MTGGGVFPALAVLQAIKGKTNDVLWIGSQGGMEANLLKDQNLRFETIEAGGIHGVGLHSLPGNLMKLVRGYQQAKALIQKFNPDVMFFTGGYLGVPVAYAGRRIPSVVFVPDIEPGLALKGIIRFAEAVALSAPNSSEQLHHPNIKVTGYPVRKELHQWSRRNARIHFGINESRKVLLVYGGSKGARSINQALSNCLESLLIDMDVIHISGQDNWKEAEEVIHRLNPQMRSKYHAHPFLKEDMGAAFAAADLAVCRAGASTLGELPLFGLPAILVPYPHAWRYQHKNAEYLQSKGGALVLEDDALEQELLPTIRQLMGDDKRLFKMSNAMCALSHPKASESIAEIILQVSHNCQRKEVNNG